MCYTYIMKTMSCIECKKELSDYRTKRCQSCEAKRRHILGIFNSKEKNNPNYKDGRTNLQHRCINCNKKVSRTSYYGNGRCRSCARKEQYKLKPNSHPMYKDGRTLKENICECGNKIKNYNAKRCISCAFDLNNNPNWRGGKSFEEYTINFTEELKESIRKRDGHKCRNCGINKYQHYKKHNKNFPVHHIDYNKQNCKEDNLISLCVKCHAKTNGNRDLWTIAFKFILGV